MQDRQTIDFLLKIGVLTHNHLKTIREEAELSGGSLVDIAMKLGFIDEKDLAKALARKHGLQFLDLQEQKIPEEVLTLLKPEFIEQHLVCPVSLDGEVLTIGMVDPVDIEAEDLVRRRTGHDIRRVVVTGTGIRTRLQRQQESDSKSYLADILAKAPEELPMEFEEYRDTADEQGEDERESAPVIRLVNTIISDAIRMGASDIHLEPRAKEVIIRYRMDGRLATVLTIPKNLQASVTSRFKLISSMDISEKRKPQDGRTFVRLSDRTVDMRVATLPTYFGEEIVLRILDRAKLVFSPELLGFGPDHRQVFDDFLAHSQGIILITGPTGSGKTSTLYTALHLLNKESRKIITVEDPIEFQVQGINQVQINERAGISFAGALRSILRHDPNIIMVGEIRDLETAEIAFQAAQTGHLVLSTLHTQDSLSAISRLVDLGLPHFLISSSLIGVIAQRLVRRLCVKCRERITLPPGEEALFPRLPVDGGERTFFASKGCEECSYQGFKGRIGLYEFLRMDTALRTLIAERQPIEKMMDAAARGGMRTMAQDGLLKIASGVTTLQEVRDVVYIEHDSPRETPAPSSGAPAPSPSAEAGLPAESDGEEKARRILVVDDEEAITVFLGRVLGAAGYEVLTACSGAEGLRIAFQERPHLLILDVMMPGLDGYEMLRILRSNLATSRIPVIFLTGRLGEEYELKGLSVGADDYLTKPISVERLRLRVEALLRRS